MASLSSMGGGIKSVQRGVISAKYGASGTATITAVNVAKSELRFLGSNGSDSTNASVYLVNSTTVAASCNSSNYEGVNWELTEWK